MLGRAAKIGALAGVASGVAASAYYQGKAFHLEKEEGRGRDAAKCIEKAAGSVLAGPFVGAGTGMGLYQGNKILQNLRVAPATTKAKVVIALTTTALSTLIAYQSGNNGGFKNYISRRSL